MWKCDSEANNIFSHEIRSHESKEVLWLWFLDLYLKQQFSFIKKQSTIKPDTDCKEAYKRSKMFLKSI